VRERAIADARGWVARGADKSAARSTLGGLLLRLGRSYAEADDARHARAPLEESLAIARDLARADPQNETLQGDVALRLMLTADVLLDLRQAATPMLAEAAGMGRSLVARNPNNLELKDMLAQMLGAQAQRASADGDRNEARKLWTEVATLRAGLSAAAPRDASRLRDLAAAHKRVGDLSARMNDRDGAVRAYANVVTTRRALAALSPDDAQAKRALAASLRELGTARARNDNPRGAIRALAEAAQIRLKLADEHDGHRSLALEAVADLAQMPLAQAGAGASQARPAIEHARATLTTLLSNYPNDQRFADALARTQALLDRGAGAT
jgi:tetratricopeptide (TPR) repeat protein